MEPYFSIWRWIMLAMSRFGLRGFGLVRSRLDATVCPSTTLTFACETSLRMSRVPWCSLTWKDVLEPFFAMLFIGVGFCRF